MKADRKASGTEAGSDTGGAVAFGRSLDRHMVERGMTQADLAVKVGTTQPNISKLCRGRRQCGIRLATRLAEALGLEGSVRAHFLIAAKRPAWKGFEDTEYGLEAILSDCVLKVLAAAGIRREDVLSATVLPQGGDRKADAVLVMKSGEAVEVEIKVRRKGKGR